jgi:predicted GNAT family N-acyltransferase
LIFKVADEGEREEALALRRAVYARDWPDVAIEQVIDRADQTAHHLVALSDNAEVVAALRIVTSAQRPFDLERFIGLDSVIPAGRNPAEIGRLCVAHGKRHVGPRRFVHLGMLKLALDICGKLQISDLLITSLPQLRNFYRAGFFNDVGVVFKHGTWGPVHVMRLDVERANATLANSQSRLSKHLASRAQ